MIRRQHSLIGDVEHVDDLVQILQSAVTTLPWSWIYLAATAAEAVFHGSPDRLSVLKLNLLSFGIFCLLKGNTIARFYSLISRTSYSYNSPPESYLSLHWWLVQVYCRLRRVVSIALPIFGFRGYGRVLEDMSSNMQWKWTHASASFRNTSHYSRC